MTRRRFVFQWDRTKPRTAAEKRARKMIGWQFKRLRREIRDQRKAKS